MKFAGGLRASPIAGWHCARRRRRRAWVSRIAPSCAGATARGGGSRRSLRCRLARVLGAAIAPVDAGGAGAGVVPHPLLGPHGQRALPREAGGRSRLQASYNWLRNRACKPRRRRAAPGVGSGGASGRAALRCPVMLHRGRLGPRVCPRSRRRPDRPHGRCDQRYLAAFFVAEEGTMSSFQGVSAIRAKGLFCSLGRPQPLQHARGGGKVDKDTPTQVGSAPGAARHRVDPGLGSRQGGARSALSRRPAEALPQELRLAAITDWPGPSFLNGGLPAQHNARFAPRPRTRALPSSPSRSRRAQRHPVHPRGTHRSNDNTVRSSAWHFRSSAGRPPPTITSRPGSASTNTPTAQWPSSIDRDAWRDTTPM